MELKIDKNFKKIIIGHTGYIGSLLLKKVVKGEENILGISRKPSHFKEKAKNKNFSEIQYDIFKEKIFEKLNFESKPTIYICAHNTKTNFSQKRKSLSYVYNSNKENYNNFIKNIKKLNPGKLIFLSTGGSLYDNTEVYNPSYEDSNLNPLSEYGLSKFILESFLSNFSQTDQIPLVIGRVSTIYGDSPASKKFGFINYLKYCSLKNITPVIYGKNTFRDYLHIKDLVDILIKIEKKNLFSNTYNISYGKSYSCLQIYNKVKNHLNNNGLKIKSFEDKGSRQGENKNIFISSLKLREEINWTPRINVNDGIKNLLIN